MDQNTQKKKQLQDGLIFLFFILGSTAISMFLGQDANFDLKNYHFYNAWALLEGRFSVDFFAAGTQTYFNPLLDVVNYLFIYPYWKESTIMFQAFLGLPAGILGYMVYLVFGDLIPKDGTSRESSILLLVVVAIALSGSAFVSQLGTTFNEIQISIFVIGSVWGLLQYSKFNSIKWVVFSGAMIGIAIGLKFTAIVYAPGLAIFLTFLMGKKDWGLIVKTIGILIASSVGVALVLWGWWGILVYSSTGNPIFPLFNQVFHSPLVAPVSWTDGRFKPSSLVKYLFYPFLWIFPNSGKVTEPLFSDPRFAFAQLFAILSVSIILVKKPKLERRLLGFVWFIVISYVIWISLFSILRYAVPIEVLIPVFIVLFISAIGRAEGTRTRDTLAISICVLVISIGLTSYPDWGRNKTRETVLSISNSERKLDDGSLVLFLGNPQSFLAPLLAKETKGLKFIGIDWFVISNSRYGIKQEIGERIAKHDGKMFGIVRNDGIEALGYLKEFGLEPALSNSWSLRTPGDSFTVLPVLKIGQPVIQDVPK